MHFRIGIDLGGTKTEILALDEKGRELLRERAPTPAKNYGEIVSLIAKLVREAETNLRASAQSVGVGIPGAISPATGLIKNANTTCLIGKRFDHDLEAAVGRPVHLANDANCFALSEATDGAGAGHDVVFGVILGTGTGGGVVVRGHVLGGPNSIAGEWGHNPLPWPLADELPGPACYCGKNGCIETFLSGPGISRDHQLKGHAKFTASELEARAREGDANAEETLKRYEERLAKSLASVINILDPNVIVLGGGVSNLERLYENVPKIWGKYVFSDEVDTKLVRAKHGDSSGVRGAAWLRA